MTILNRKQEILRRLSGSGDYVSGQELCEMLVVSRTAVWKNIQKLKEEGYPIEAVTNKGYRLLSVEEADILDREQISAKLTTAWAGRPLIYREETGSTNDDIFALAAQGYPHGTLLVASRQTAGKGRRGRTWISPREGNVYMSILLKPDLPPDVTPMLTVVMALSVYQASVDAAAEQAGQPENDAARCRFGIKWPNDIVVSVDGGPYRKLCGILTEMRMEDREISAITIGIGLNVNQTDFAPEISENATSYNLALGRKINRAALTAGTWNHFEENYSLFTQTQDFSKLHDAYEEGLVNKGRAVHVLDPRAPFTGTAVGINLQGELLVQPDDGSQVRTIASGEVSVRGVKGYV
jgi:BirA family biotin operon repressor/biotin-[acetyl-CoA-carboxylase] ligase